MTSLHQQHLRHAQSSQALFERARKVVPAGTHSNSRIRQPHPIYADRADGAHLVDADGHRWLDCQMGNGSVILGHAHPVVQDAVTAAVRAGIGTGTETADAVEAAELLIHLVPDADQVRFASTGSEAVTHALHIARHATGRPRVAKVEASYHGWSDPVWVSNWPSPEAFGPRNAPNTVAGSAGLSEDAGRCLVLPFNDTEASVALIDEHKDELAAIVLEPILIDIGFVPATRDYLEGLREATRRHGIVLLFDELLTGFRVAPGGARELYGVRPDLTTYGKAIANGYPVAAVEGDADLLAHTDPTRGGPVGWVGTYNGHALAMAATRATLSVLASGEPLRHLDRLTDRLQTGARELAQRYGRPLVVAGAGGHFQPYFTDTPPTDYRSALASDPGAYRRFVDAASQRSVLVADKPLLHCALSAAHTTEHVDEVLACTEDALRELEEVG